MIKTIKKVAVIIMTVVIMISTVTIADQASSTTVQAASGYSGKIYKHWCKLRTAKSKRSKTIKKLSVGTKVTVLSTSGSWRKIKVGNKTGYALKKYVYISTNAPKLTGSTYNKGQTVAISHLDIIFQEVHPHKEVQDVRFLTVINSQEI